MPSLHRWWCAMCFQVLRREGSTSLKEVNSVNCWKCGKHLPLPRDTALFFCLCDKKIVLPPTTANYFKLLGYPQRYAIDLKCLRLRYMDLQKELHPDILINKSKIEADFSSQQSLLINKAYSTLNAPYKRGVYLLELLGYPITEEDASDAVDVQFLENIIMINEKLAEMEKEKDNLVVLKKETEACLQELEETMSAHFEKGDLPSAKETLMKMKYYLNIHDRLHYVVPNE